jgi:hypothetical protein
MHRHSPGTLRKGFRFQQRGCLRRNILSKFRQELDQYRRSPHMQMRLSAAQRHFLHRPSIGSFFGYVENPPLTRIVEQRIMDSTRPCVAYSGVLPPGTVVLDPARVCGGSSRRNSLNRWAKGACRRPIRLDKGRQTADVYNSASQSTIRLAPNRITQVRSMSTKLEVRLIEFIYSNCAYPSTAFTIAIALGMLPVSFISCRAVLIASTHIAALVIGVRLA